MKFSTIKNLVKTLLYLLLALSVYGLIEYTHIIFILVITGATIGLIKLKK